MPYNLKSPKGLIEPVDFADMTGWFARETEQATGEPLRLVLRSVANHLKDFVKWPDRALLLWEGCDRKVPEGERHRYYKYPPEIQNRAKERKIVLDGRANGPAIAAYHIAGGFRPERFGSANRWSIHHVYSGKFPYIGHPNTTHATTDCKHFTQSAGLVAVHPVADALCDEFPFFAWLLRAKSFETFRYDPDGVFSTSQDGYGFVTGSQNEVVHPATPK
jgi:hypothetical protein